jgi:hypothetical protein
MRLKMNITPSKAYFLAALCLSTAIPSAATGITPMPHYLRCLKQQNGKNYAFNCVLIDVTRIIRGLSLLMYYRTTHKKKNLDQAISVIHNQLKEFETWLVHEEENVLITLKNKYRLSDKAWHACKKDIYELKNIYTQAMQQTWPTTHDENLPADLVTSLKTALIRNNINPESITIKMVTDTHSKTLLQVISGIDMHIDRSDNSLVIDKHYTPMRIELFPSVHNSISPKKTIAFCAHEVQHIVQHHGLTDLIMQSYLEHYCSIDKATLTACPEYQKLIQIHEAQAEILSAIKDSDVADCLKVYRSDTYYPNYLYEEHYYNLSNIDMLWKLDSWLNFIHHNGIHNKANDLIVKIHTLADSFKELLA